MSPFETRAPRQQARMSFHVYVLECADGSYYTGHTDDIEKRLAGHELGS